MSQFIKLPLTGKSQLRHVGRLRGNLISFFFLLFIKFHGHRNLRIRVVN